MPFKSAEDRRAYQRDRYARQKAKAKKLGQPPASQSPQNPVSTTKSKNEFRGKGTKEGEGGTPAWVVALIVLALIGGLVWFLFQLQRYYLGW